MKQRQILAIDVSKRTLDICIQPSGKTFQITNDLNGFKVFRAHIDPGFTPLVVLEYTGLYSMKLELYLQNQQIDYCKLPALEIKRSMGMVRGKSDKIDAVRIAEYAWLRRDQLKSTDIPAECLLKLNQLISLRSKLVKDASGYKTRLKEMIASGTCTKGDASYKIHQTLLKAFRAEIKKIEINLGELLAQEPELKKNFDLITTIKGVGKIVAYKMLAVSGNFKKIKNARKFNCYAGLAPFKHESGSSLRSKARVSHLANKEIKSLLSMAAFAAIRWNKELKEYYEKRVAEGKRKMSCINIVRAKLVSRMFAIVKRQSPYEELLFAA